MKLGWQVGVGARLIDIHYYCLQLISTVQSRLGVVWVDPDYLSEDFLVRCLERKGGHPKGTVASYRDMWGVKGRKKVGSMNIFLSVCVCIMQ